MCTITAFLYNALTTHCCRLAAHRSLWDRICRRKDQSASIAVLPVVCPFTEVTQMAQGGFCYSLSYDVTPLKTIPFLETTLFESLTLVNRVVPPPPLLLPHFNNTLCGLGFGN